MAEIINVTIEQSGKNILVDYIETLYDSTGTEVSTQNTRKGYNPDIADDWDSVESDATLKPYADIAWAGLRKPVVEDATEINS